MKNADDVVEEALRRVEAGRGGADFVLRDLFGEDEWNAILVGRRRAAGVKFRKVMISASRGPDTKNHQHYDFPVEGKD